MRDYSTGKFRRRVFPAWQYVISLSVENSLMSSIKPADAQEETVEVSLTGQALLENPLLNKGSAFSEEERREFGLMGLLPPHVSTVDEQLTRTYGSFKQKDSDLERYIYLVSLQ